jgi:hypothetical protein
MLAASTVTEVVRALVMVYRSPPLLFLLFLLLLVLRQMSLK